MIGGANGYIAVTFSFGIADSRCFVTKGNLISRRNEAYSFFLCAPFILALKEALAPVLLVT